MDTTRVTANDVEFEYLRWGTGDRLALCLHGFPDDAGTFDRLATRLANHGFTVVAPYMRGYGPTSRAPDGDYSAGALGRDAVALADELGESFDTDDVVLVGHDWGAVAAYVAAAIDPSQFSHIVAMAVPPGFPRVARSHPRQWLRSWYMGFFQVPSLPERALRDERVGLIELLWGLWSPGWNDANHIAAVEETFREPGTVEAALEYYRQFARGVVADVFSTGGSANDGIRVPGLVMAGERDGCIGSELFVDTDDAFATETDCRVVTVRGAGHFTHRERPDVVANEVTAFAGH